MPIIRQNILRLGARMMLGLALLATTLVYGVLPAAAAPRVVSVGVGAQSAALTAGTPGTVTYIVTVTKGTTSSLTLSNLTVAGLPTGASGTFSPTNLSWTSSQTGAKTATLTINTTALAAAGATPFTVTAVRSGTASDNAAGSGTLTVGAASTGSSVTYDLYATTGTLSLPGGGSVPIWGYSTSATAGSATLPGPTIDVPVGTTLTVNLHNNLAVASSLHFDAQSLATDKTGAAGGTVKPYTFTASKPGTFLYEAGLTANGSRQVAMGMFGALVVRPATAGQAYASAVSAYNDEAVLVLSEIDPALNANPTSFDMRLYAPKYWLVNGKAFPNTVNIDTAASRKVLLRYLNAGIRDHGIGVLGMHQNVIAADGHPLTFPYQVVAETVPAGATLDTIATIPAGSPIGAKFALYNAAMHLDNAGAAVAYSTPIDFGGMLAFLNVTSGTTTGDTAGPVTSGVSFAPSASTNGSADVTLNVASISDQSTGQSGVTAAEYFVDTVGANGSGCALTGTFSGQTVTDASATIPAAAGATAPCVDLATLSSGNHTFYVHGKDGANNWGQPVSAVLNLDKAGPKTTGVVLTPAVSQGTLAVSIQASGDDSTTGNSNVVAASYSLDGGAAVAMSLNQQAPVVSLSASIAAPLAAGVHTVAVSSQDAGGNVGAPTTAYLTIDTTPPTTSNVVASPNPNNGAQASPSGGVSSFPSLRVDATFADATITNGSYSIVAAEGFVDNAGVTGNGFAFQALDGVFNLPSESGYGLIPLTTINALPEGTHAILVHAKDAAGNWGPYSNATLTIDKTAPTFASITLAPNPTVGAANVTLTLNGASDPVSGGVSSGIAGGEYWINPPTTTTPAPGSGTQFSGLTPSIPVGTLVPGGYTVSVRIRDAAGNWSTVIRTAVLTVSYPPIYFSTSGSTNPPGVAGTADDADIYYYNGAGFSRAIDVSTAAYGLPSGANVDGFDRVDDTHFYMSFNGQVAVPGIGNVQDEDVVYYNAGTWSLFFDGSARGLATGSFDLDAISIVGGTLYFSTDNSNLPPGAGGTGDDADIYRWNGASTYTRVFDASANGLPTGANVDGFVRVDDTHFYMSFNSTTTAVPVIGNVPDEDIVYYNAGTWSVYFDGTVLGLTNNNHDIDAFDLP